MFKLSTSELIIGGTNWILRIDEEIIDKEVVPVKCTYIGRVSIEEEGEKILFNTIDDNKSTEIDYIPVEYLDGIINTGRFIVATTRSRLIQIVRNTATRPIMNQSLHTIPSRYIKKLNEPFPEILI